MSISLILLILFIVFEWALRFVMLFIVPHGRRPSSATAWLMIIMIEPIVGSILFAVLGTPKLPKVRRALQRTADQFTADELKKLRSQNNRLFTTLSNDDHQTVAKLAETLGGLPAMAGNKATFITDYNGAFQEQVRAFDAAQSYIHIEYFIIALDQDTEPVFQALERAVARGIVVRVLFDALACRPYPGFKQMKRRLTKIGVQWRATLPLNLVPGRNFTRPDLRNHRKIVVVDGRIGFTGSQNLVTKNYHRKDEIYYEELVARVEGPAVWQFNNVFRADWYAETGQDLKELVEDIDITKPAGEVVAQVLPSGPSHENDNNLKLYTGMIHSAKKSVFIVVPYFVPDESLMTAITSAAQRGVRVTIINSNSIDKILAGHAQRSFYDELLKAGVQVFLYKSPVFLHTKHVSIDDDVVILGSSNLDIRSFELDQEVSLVLYDGPAVRVMRKIEQTYLENSDQIHPAEWAARPLRLKLLDNISRLTASLQ